MRSLGLSSLAVLSLAGAASAQTMEMGCRDLSAGTGVAVGASGLNETALAREIGLGGAKLYATTLSRGTGQRGDDGLTTVLAVDGVERTAEHAPAAGWSEAAVGDFALIEARSEALVGAAERGLAVGALGAAGVAAGVNAKAEGCGGVVPSSGVGVVQAVALAGMVGRRRRRAL